MDFIDYASADYQAWRERLAEDDKALVGPLPLDRIGEFNNKQLERRIELRKQFLQDQQRKAMAAIKESPAQKTASKIAESDNEEESETLILTNKVCDAFTIRCTGQNEKLLICANGSYSDEDAEPKVKRYLEELHPNISTKEVNEVIGKIRRKRYVNENLFDNNPYMINFEDCWYNWLEDKKYPHSPELLSRQQLPYPYPDKKTLPKSFYKFMLEIHYATEVKTAMEWMAYTFMRQNKFELVCFKIGYGKNGKTTEDNPLRALHGGQIINGSVIGSAVTGFSDKQIKESRWATGSMKRAALNIDAETDGHPIDMTDLKRLASRDTIHQVESKGIDFESAIFNTKFQMNFNKDPIITNQSDGDVRRLLMLSYPHQFEGKNEDVDLDLDAKLQSKEELSAIFSWVIAPALRRLHKAKSIYMAENTIERRRLRYELLSDPLRAAAQDIFTDEGVIDEDYTTKKDAARAYIKFCQKNKLAILSERKFSQYLKGSMKLQEGKQGPRGKQVEAWLGVRLNPIYSLEDDQQSIIVETQ
jgi:putative DNA primase/helicase